MVDMRGIGGAVVRQRVEVVASHRPDPYGLTTYELPFDRVLTFGPEKRAGETTIHIARFMPGLPFEK